MAANDRKTSPASDTAPKESTGAGAEGAAAINRVSGDSRRGQGAEEKGSEPLEGTERIHKPSYGGEGGEPRISSDQRESRR